MQRVAERGLSLGAARALARDYYPCNAASPQIMAAGIAQIWDEDLRIPLVVNLYEECGKGDKVESHVALFERFMHAVDVTPAAAARIPAGSRTEALIHTYLRVCSEGPDFRALAMLHAFEDIFAYICGSIAASIEASQVVDAHAGEFFSLHSVADITHAERMRGALLDATEDHARWQEALSLARLAASLVYDLFDQAVQVDPI